MLRRLAALVVLAPLAAHAQVTCGSTVGPRQRVALAADVGPCDGVDAAIVVDSATLDLAGFTVSCADLDRDGALPQGIVLTGRKAKVTGGSVVGCSNGVGLAGDGKHTVQGMTVRDSQDDGIDVLPTTAKNKIVGNTASGNVGDGFYVRGDKSKIKDNVATANGADGIDLPASADRNRLVADRADGNGENGIQVSGTRNRLIRSSASQNVADGIRLGGGRNQVVGGVAMGNGTYDVEGCPGNKVRKLSFASAAPDCR